MPIFQYFWASLCASILGGTKLGCRLTHVTSTIIYQIMYCLSHLGSISKVGMAMFPVERSTGNAPVVSKVGMAMFPVERSMGNIPVVYGDGCVCMLCAQRHIPRGTLYGERSSGLWGRLRVHAMFPVERSTENGPVVCGDGCVCMLCAQRNISPGMLQWSVGTTVCACSVPTGTFSIVYAGHRPTEYESILSNAFIAMACK